MKISKKDEKYFEQFPADPDFSVEHNKRVIEETIKETEKNIRKKKREQDEPYRERAHAVSRYLSSLQQKGGSKNVEKYFGKRYLAKLRGKEALARIQDKLRVVGSDGQIIKRSE